MQWTKFFTVRMVSLLALILGYAQAQDYRARVQGRVTDATQAVLVGAKVT